MWCTVLKVRGTFERSASHEIVSKKDTRDRITQDYQEAMTFRFIHAIFNLKVCGVYFISFQSDKDWYWIYMA